MRRVKEKGQAMTEFALMIPILILLLFGMTFAAFYAFRSAAVDWGVFIEGVASGSYNTPATGIASQSELWPDLRDRISAGQSGSRQVRSLISVEDSRDWVFGIRLLEAQRAETFFRLWRFYPGPPSGAIE
ncbi:MAG: TadE/TadG family type IV pilus assembly protein [Chloroflexota bacterium]